jgi:hypothetical protein
VAALTRRRWLPYALLFLAAALISGFTMLRGIDPFDEGLVLQAARRTSEGQAPYGDFLWAYGPAQPYLLAGLFKAFGVSLVQWRILRVLADAGVALVVFVLLRRQVSGRVALVGWLAAACAMAQPRSANPFPFALLLALVAVAAAAGPGGGSTAPARRRMLAAGALSAAAAAFRLDFALYAAAGVIAAAVLSGDPGRERVRAVATYAAAAAALTLLVYAPFLIDVGPSRLYDSLVGTSLHERGYWTLSFPIAYHGRSGVSPHAIKDLLDFYQPLLLVLGLAVAAVALALALRAGATGVRAARAAAAGVTLFGLGGLSYLLSRTDEFHTQPLFAALCALLPAVAAWGWAERARRGAAVAGAAAALVFAPLLAHAVADRLSMLFRPEPMSTVHLAAAGGAQAPPAEARALERVVADVHARVPPGEPIYVAPRRSDLVTYTNAIVYVLADRDNAARRDFGLLTGASAQRDIVRRLEARRPRVVVRWTDPLSSKVEPNRRGHPSGVHLVDGYLAANYRLLERLYHYDVLVPR